MDRSHRLTAQRTSSDLASALWDVLMVTVINFGRRLVRPPLPGVCPIPLCLNKATPDLVTSDSPKGRVI